MQSLTRMRGLALLATFVTITSCGRTQSDSGNGDGNRDAGGSAGDRNVSELAEPCGGPCEDDGERPEPLPRPHCPATEPSLGDPCNMENLVCSYGDSLTPHCRTYYECTEEAGQSIWMASALVDQQAWPCLPLPSDYCPAEVPASGDACVIEAPGIPCGYAEVSCLCSARTPTPGAPGSWDCYGAPRNTACPATLPNIGEGCGEEQEGIQCNYSLVCAPPHSSVFCYRGEWEPGEDPGCHL